MTGVAEASRSATLRDRPVTRRSSYDAQVAQYLLGADTASIVQRSSRLTVPCDHALQGRVAHERSWKRPPQFFRPPSRPLAFASPVPGRA